MSPRKRTIEDLDDIDDEDGIVEQEAAEETDLTLHEASADSVGLGGSEAAAAERSRPRPTEEGEE
jgi:hypothetical protein